MMDCRSKAIIQLKSLDHNLSEVRRLAPGRKICVMVKGNAYGHGMVPLAQHLSGQADYFGVAFLEEAILLRQHNITAPIIVFSPIIQEQIAAYVTWQVEATVASISALEMLEAALANSGHTLTIHLKIDTGMRRIGIRHTNAWKLFALLDQAPHCHLGSVYSHLAMADEPDPQFTEIQYERFQEALSWFEHHQRPRPMCHIANSAAILRFPALHLDMVRPGIMLYGYHPGPVTAPLASLQPLLSWVARITYFKVIEKDTSVGYGLTWTADKDCRAVTIPVGYADGFPRQLSNAGEVLIQGKRYPVIGRVCMDQTIIAIGDGEAYLGDEVVIIGRQGSDAITADEFAEKCGTISYEVLTRISQRVERVFEYE